MHTIIHTGRRNLDQDHGNGGREMKEWIEEKKRIKFLESIDCETMQLVMAANEKCKSEGKSLAVEAKNLMDMAA
jgi:hypothetical protein